MSTLVLEENSKEYGNSTNLIDDETNKDISQIVGITDQLGTLFKELFSNGNVKLTGKVLAIFLSTLGVANAASIGFSDSNFFLEIKDSDPTNISFSGNFASGSSNQIAALLDPIFTDGLFTDSTSILYNFGTTNPILTSSNNSNPAYDFSYSLPLSTFENIFNLPALALGTTFDTNYITVNSDASTNVYPTNVNIAAIFTSSNNPGPTTIPEPSPSELIGTTALGLGALYGIRRKKEKNEL